MYILGKQETKPVLHTTQANKSLFSKLSAPSILDLDVVKACLKPDKNERIDAINRLKDHPDLLKIVIEESKFSDSIILAIKFYPLNLVQNIKELLSAIKNTCPDQEVKNAATEKLNSF